jgi:hypothetical protein
VRHLLLARFAGHNDHRADDIEVVVASDGTLWLAIATQRGSVVDALPDIVDGVGLDGGSLGLPAAVVHAAIEADLVLLCKLQPRLVLLDWRPSMRLAAALLNIPVVAVVNAHVTRHYRGPLAAPEQHPITRHADRLMPLLAPLFHRRWAQPYRQYARTHGQPG